MSSPNIQFADLKTLAGLLYAQFVGSGKILDGDTGNPSGLALILDLIHQRIVGYPYEWNFLKVKSSFTLDGSLSYNLSTLFPDLLSVYQIYGINNNQSSAILTDYDANVYPFYDGYQIVGDLITFTGNAPVAGTVAKIQYKSSYMVFDNTGTRKRYFTAADDYSALRPGWDGVLTYGIGQFVDWVTDSKAKEQRMTCDAMYKEAFTNLLLHNPQTAGITGML